MIYFLERIYTHYPLPKDVLLEYMSIAGISAQELGIVPAHEGYVEVTGRPVAKEHLDIAFMSKVGGSLRNGIVL